MIQKNISVFVGVVIGVWGLLVSCNDSSPNGPQSTDITGTWTALTSSQNQGAGKPDTFTCILTINGAGTYAIQRGHVTYGSSGSTVDSAKEAGTWAKKGTDSLVLTPTGTACYYFDPGYNNWLKCDGSADAGFRTCPEPFHIKINISGNQWLISLVRYDDPVKIVDYTLKK